jgi:hypothetical protein
LIRPSVVTEPPHCWLAGNRSAIAVPTPWGRDPLFSGRGPKGRIGWDLKLGWAGSQRPEAAQVHSALFVFFQSICLNQIQIIQTSENCSNSSKFDKNINSIAIF